MIPIGVCSYSNFFLCRLFFAQVEVVDEWLAQTANHVTEEKNDEMTSNHHFSDNCAFMRSKGLYMLSLPLVPQSVLSRTMNGALLKIVIRKVTGTITSIRA